MRFRRQRRSELAVNLTPLIDVVFLLLIFFMVSTTFTRESQLSVDLPEADARPAQPDTKTLELMIDESGNFRLNGEALVDDRVRTIQAALYARSKGDTTRALLIAADADAAHKHVVKAMDAAGQMGFTRLSIATVQGGAADQ